MKSISNRLIYLKVNCKSTELFILFLNWNEWTLTISSIYIIDFRHVWTIKSDLIVKPLLITLPLSRISKHPKTNLAQMVRLHKILIYNEICLKELIKMSNSPIVISWFNIWKDLLIYNIGDASNKARIFCFYSCTQNLPYPIRLVGSPLLLYVNLFLICIWLVLNWKYIFIFIYSHLNF